GQGSGSAAGRITEHQVELVPERELGGIQNAKMYVGRTSEDRLHRLQTRRTYVASSDRCGWIALSDDGSLASGGGTAVQNFSASASQLRDELRSFILHTERGTHDKNTPPPGRGRSLSGM